MVSSIRKRDGGIVAFNQRKIASAIAKALKATGSGDEALSGKLSLEVVSEIDRSFPGKVPGIENVQDLVEKVLIREGLSEAAKAYILYRDRRARERGLKKVLGVRDDLKLGVNAISVLERRYLAKDNDGNVTETPGGMFHRVAKAVASVDLKYGKTFEEVYELEARFYELMSSLVFLPNSPTLMNAGTSMGQLSACFVVPVEDSMESIFDAVKSMAIIHQSGGGTGFSFSGLRPSGDVVKSTGGVASGPVSFMRVFDAATDVIKQGGRRRGANMGILRVDHPDILEFIKCKEDAKAFNNFNISVGLTDGFMKALLDGRDYPLINPRTGKETKRLDAGMVYDLIAETAWKTGDPGIVFLDEINRYNPTPKQGMLESTNPCGEQPLLPYESCNLGSINLSKMVAGGMIDWGRLGSVVRDAVHFLDNVIDSNRFPLPETEKATKENRKIGLGVMGFAEMLILLGVPYDSDKAVELAEEVMSYLDREAKKRSEEIGMVRGSFPGFAESIWAGKYKALRNATVTTVAPTGSISIIAGCSSGIEPLFAISFVRNVMGGVKMVETNGFFEETAKMRGFYSEDLMAEVASKGTIKGIGGIPDAVKKVYVTAHDISYEWHVKMQAAFQKYTDNAVSKTINMPEDATPKDVENAYMLAYKLKCKGITVYRYASKDKQVLSFSGTGGERKKYVEADCEYAGGCPKDSCRI